MSAPRRSATLCLTALAAACGDGGSGLAAPDPPPPPAAVPGTLVAPAIGLSTHRMSVALERQLQVTSTGTALRWTAASEYAWIVVSPSSGTTPTSATVSVEPRKLAAGRPVTGSFTIAAAGASNSPQRVSVVVNATGQEPLPTTALAVSDSALGFCFSPGSTRNCVRLSEQVRLTSTGPALAWRAVSGQPWIAVTSAGGTTPTDVLVSVDPAQTPLTRGASVSGSITVSVAGASNSPLTIPVKLQFYSVPLPQ